ncbi:zonula occludens toxin [Shewanella psychrophila]|uniref:Zonula occludens toxin n=1 Tax=Shewanella psychrophila TaxID=225848 RepID=A0A1S6HKS5_9GAMM|nr:zonular occludens toxin domain-containing protein [Shewanella psychrophila]AQS36127.1 zonula occludens toxin [Shewanella psychrophila]
MLFLITGKGGASKSLNTVAAMVRSNSGDRPNYYTNVKLFMLDYDVASSFSGWFYGFYLYNLKDKRGKAKLLKIMKRIHNDEELVTLADVPWLESYYEAHDPLDTWLFWVFKLYSKTQLKVVKEFIENMPSDYLTFEQLKQFNLHFTHFEDARKWYELPKTSVIFIDECQHFFPPRQTGSSVPKHIAEFSTHRHRGYDIHLVTQDRMFLDNNVRKLANRHIHYHNPFGGKRVTRYTHSEQFDSTNYFDLQKTEKSFIKRPSNFYGSYFSAELHTHKFKMPKMAFVGVALVAFLIFTCYLLYGTLFKERGTVEGEVATSDTSKASKTSIAVQKITYKDSLVPSEQAALVSFVSTLTTDVYIDGSIATYDVYGAVKYDYSFSNKVTEDIFSPSAVGFTVKQFGSCLVKLTLYDYTTFVTCDPFYRIEPVSDDSANNGDFFVSD